MSQLLKEIYCDLSNPIFKNYKFIYPEESIIKSRLENLSQINIFIGPNNSGKSRFLRSVFKSITSEVSSVHKASQSAWGEDYLAQYDTVDFAYFDIRLIQQAIFEHDVYVHQCIKNEDNVVKLTSGLDEIKKRYLNRNIYKCGLNFRQYYDCRNELNSLYASIGIKEFNPGISNFVTTRGVGELEEKYDTYQAIIRQMDQNYKNAITEINFHTTYIPSLRSLRNIAGEQLKNRTLLDYFDNDGNFRENIFTGENIYMEVKKLLSGRARDHAKLNQFEEFLSKYFFKNAFVKITAPDHKEDDDKQNIDLHITVGKEHERVIYDIGDGVQAIIILTFPLFEFQDKKHLIFIEEPELYLHPGLQRIFIETLNSGVFPLTQVFITTHSNHFLDLTLDETSNISIYTFKKDTKNTQNPKEESTFKIENVSNPDMSVLDLIGVRNSSVFLSNCTIWVEGITDRLYIRKLLEIFQNEKYKRANLTRSNFDYFLEDIHFSFVEYGGNNITHWSFLDDGGETTKSSHINVERLCGKLFLISDKDKGDKGKKGERHILLEKKLGDRYFRLKVREIENMLTPDIIVKTVEVLEARRNNNQIEFNSFDYLDYQEVPLGNFIDKKVFKNGHKKKYADASGTINDKLVFAQVAISNIESANDLSDDAIALGEKLHGFIKLMND